MKYSYLGIYKNLLTISFSMEDECPFPEELKGNINKLRLLLLFRNYGPMTAKQILALNMGYTKTTLYRMLNSLEEIGALTVVSESKVRAMTEKTYDVCEEMKILHTGIIGEDPAMYAMLFRGFAMNISAEFDAYAARGDGNPSKDGTGFTRFTVFATPEEYEEVMAKFKEIVKPLLRKRSEDQSVHTMAFISSPPYKPSEDIT